MTQPVRTKYRAPLVLAVVMIAGALGLHAQDWIPKRIVAITNYVPLGAQARISGDVVIKCSVADDGSVLSAEVVSGHSVLKAQAQENALLWKFQRDGSGQPERNSITLTYRYRLGEDSQPLGKTSFVVDLPNMITIIAPEQLIQP